MLAGMNQAAPMGARRLRAIFHSVIAAALAPISCEWITPADFSADARITPADFSANVCASLPPESSFRTLVGVTPGIAVDYFSIREETNFAGTAEPNVVRERGTPCATASDPTACRAALAATRSPTGWSMPSFGVAPTHRYLVFTQGDRVTVINNLDALGAFLAPIENPVDAWLLTVERGLEVRCGANNVRTVAGGFELLAYSGISCGSGTHVDRNVIRVSTSGAARVTDTELFENGDPNCAIGRRPSGLCIGPQTPCTKPDSHDGGVGAYLAGMAALEAASVHAFERLARELVAHGAPRSLVLRAKRAADDERRHARVTRALARRFGARVPTIRVARGGVRSLAEIAVENAAEGCVRETFGALQATLQGQRARDAEVRAAMRTIARDETRHAALAWSVARWIHPKLTDDERAAVARAQTTAIETLGRDLRIAPAGAVRASTGAPGAREAKAMLRAMTSIGPFGGATP